MSWRILITCPPMLSTLAECRERLVAENLEIVIPQLTQQLSEQELCEIIADFDGVIAGDDPFTAKVLKIGSQGRLKVVAKWGIGVDAIDLETAKKLGIYTSNTPDVFSDEVADVALGYLILLARQLHKIDSAVHQGKWLKIQGTSLSGKTVGIIGVGSIGQAIARRLHILGMNLLGYDIRSINSNICKETNLQQVDFNEILAFSDYLILSCNLTNNNYHLFNKEAFEFMKNEVQIVNVARGKLIDEKALISALDSGKVIGAALDVFEKEPLTLNDRLTKYEQVILGSHNSSNTKEAVLRVNQIAIDNLVSDLKKATV